MKKWLKRQLITFLDWFSKKIYIPRLWSRQEWGKSSSKEKLWIWYKHHDALIASGNAEFDKFLPFLTGQFLTTVAAISVYIKIFNLPEWAYYLYPVFYVAYKYAHWWLGDEIDKRDFPALTSEIQAKRQTAFRELRNATKKEAWRKGKVN